MASGWTYYLLNLLVDNYLTGATCKCMLVDASDAFDKTTVQFVSDIVANELSSGSYARQTLTGKTVTEGTNGHATWIDFNDPTFVAPTGETAAKAYIYKEVTNDADSVILWVLDGADIITNGGNVTVVLSATDGAGAINA